MALSEAALLADVFVFRLMFRSYGIPRTIRDGAKVGEQPVQAAAYFERKRLLEAFAVRKSESRHRQEKGGTINRTKFLVLSALPLDSPKGACAALNDRACSIYAKRPVSCRSVPVHYSRLESSVPHDLAEFTARPGYACDTGPEAALLFSDGRIINADIRAARSEALDFAAADRLWHRAILKYMKDDTAETWSLPTMAEIKDNAGVGAITTSMRIAWHIALNEGLISVQAFMELVQKQLDLIERELLLSRSAEEERRTLSDMRTEYRQVLGLPG